MAADRFDDDTLSCRGGVRPGDHHGALNPPVYHASTVLFPTVDAFDAAVKDKYAQVYYGRYGTPTTFALEEAVAALEGGDRAIALPTGLAAINVALLTFLGSGDHLLMVDSVYDPARAVCDRTLARFGIETTYYEPGVGAGIAGLIRPNTRLVYIESPGSLTFEVQDAPAIAAAARAAGVPVAMDNTWATPLFFKPFDHGADIVIEAATKYIGGHADLMLGLVICRQKHFRLLKGVAHSLGHAAAPDDCYLALRGLRTLPVRLHRHQETALRLARWLQQQPEVERVLHPALPDDPGHAIWQRDFRGSSGLFGVLLRPCSRAALTAMLDGMTLFGMGVSWGGYESLILPVDLSGQRSVTKWNAAGPLLRIHAGLEHPRDLIADLERGFARLRATG